MLLIQNGRVLDPYTQMDALCDVLIGDDGVIAQVAEHIAAPAGCTVYDADGLTVSPGFVDGHVHFRDPGQTQKEDVLTGAAAAAAGGSLDGQQKDHGKGGHGPAAVTASLPKQDAAQVKVGQRITAHHRPGPKALIFGYT